MSLAIYKPSQGYWVRVMTATIIGVVTLAAAAWVAGQMGVLATKLPTHIVGMRVEGVTGAPTPGQSLDLFSAADRGREGAKIGSASVDSYNASQNELRIRDVRMISATDEPARAAVVRSGPDGAGAASFSANVAKGTAAVPAIEPMLLQGGGAAVILLLGVALAFWICAVRPASVEFLISTDMEMKKVNWSTQKDIRNSTLVVIAAAVLIAASLFVTDIAFKYAFQLIGILVK